MVWITADGAAFTMPGPLGYQQIGSKPLVPEERGEPLTDLLIPGPLGYMTIGSNGRATRWPGDTESTSRNRAKADLSHSPSHPLLSNWNPLFSRKLSYQGRRLALFSGDNVYAFPAWDSYEILSQDQARQVLQDLANEPGNQGEFSEFIQKVQAALAPDWRPPNVPDGIVVFRQKPAPSITNAAHEPAITPSQMKALAAKAALEIRVVDLNSKPQEGLAFKIDRPDGGTESGKLDKDGRGRARSGSPGAFTVTFPDLDGADWDGDGVQDLPPDEERSEASRYEVKQGDRLPTIAREHGFARWQTIWDFPGNAALKDLRGNAHVLFPGDQVSISSKLVRVAEVEGGTAEYVVQSEAEVLRVRFADGDFGGERKIRFRATPDEGVPTEGPLQADGTMEIELPANTMKVDVQLFHDEEDTSFFNCTLEVGHLDPDESTSGIQARLANLGYYPGPIDGELNDATREAVVGFRLMALGDELDAVDEHFLEALGKAHKA